jgi:hypothetical protein
MVAVVVLVVVVAFQNQPLVDLVVQEIHQQHPLHKVIMVEVPYTVEVQQHIMEQVVEEQVKSGLP